MNIFYKRPLSLILCVLLGGFVFSSRAGQGVRALVWGVSAVLFCLGILFRLLFRRKTLFLSVLAACLAISTLLSFLYFDLHFTPRRYGSEAVVVSGYIEAIEEKTDYSANVTVKTEKIGGEGSDITVLLRLDSEDAMYAHAGAQISFKGKLEAISSSEDFDTRSYYYSRGICAEIGDYSDFYVSGETEAGFAEKMSSQNEKLSRHIILTMGSEAGALFAALFMGNRAYLSPRLGLNFKRIGISHILALSGMHLAILVLGITKLLSLIGINKKPRTVIIIALTLSYMALTGFSVSVVRAGIMLIISSLLYLFASVKDSLTNLSLSVFIICSIEPYAIFDVSLWLSAFATLGIIAMSELLGRITYEKTLIKRLLAWIFISLSSSFFAISATVALSSAFSGTVSLLSAVSTMLFSVLAEIFIYLGLFVLAIGSVLPIGKTVMSIPEMVISSCAEFFSSLGPVILSTENTLTKAAIYLFTLAFFAFLILKIKRKRVALAILFSFFVLIHAFAAADTYSKLYDDDILYSSASNQDIFIAKSGGSVAVLDACTYTSYMAYDTLDVLTEERIYDADAYVISHYSFGLREYLDTVLSRVKVEKLLLPEPLNDDEENIYRILKSRLAEHGVNIKTYRLEDAVCLGDISIRQTHRELYGENSMTNAFYITGGQKTVAYLGSGMLLYKTRELANKMIFNSDAVVFGAHGRKYSPSYDFYTVFRGLEKLVISSENFDVSVKARVRYKEYGTEIFTNRGTVSLIH